MSRCSHKSQVHQNWSSLHNIFTLRDMKWVLFQNFCHIIKTKLVGKLLARLCCLLLRRGSEELLHLLGCCRNLAVDRWLKHGFRDPDSTDHQGKLFEIKDQGGKKVCTTISCFEWCGDIRMTSVSHCTRKLRENSWKTQHSMWLASRNFESLPWLDSYIAFTRMLCSSSLLSL